MSRVHGKDTYISVAGSDISGYCNNSTLTRTADTEDTTVYGADDHDYDAGLGNSTGQMSGFYDDTAAGPRAVILAVLKTRTTIVRRPEGTGSGLPQESFTAIITSYQESNPVAGQILWSADFQVCGTITDTDQ